jgi:hypothetical protein
MGIEHWLAEKEYVNINAKLDAIEHILIREILNFKHKQTFARNLKRSSLLITSPQGKFLARTIGPVLSRDLMHCTKL